MIDFKYGVVLEPISQENLEIMRNQRNDSEIRRWCRQAGLISEIDQHEWFIRQNDDPKISMFEVHNSSEEIVGVCGLTDLDMLNRRAEFSLYIIRKYQLQGFSCKALKTLFTHGFRDLNLNVIWGETFEGNPAAGVFEKIGMVHEGTRRDFYFKNGKYLNAHLYSVKAKEWTF